VVSLPKSDRTEFFGQFSVDFVANAIVVIPGDVGVGEPAGHSSVAAAVALEDEALVAQIRGLRC